MVRDNTYVAPRLRLYDNKYTKRSSGEDFVANSKTTTSTKDFQTFTINSKGEIVLVAEVLVKLSELPTASFGESIENRIGSLVEGGKIWFPLEISFTAKLEKRDYKTVIKLRANSPVVGNHLVNTYNYPYKEMWGKVEAGIISSLVGEDGEGLLPLLNNLPEIDISPYLEVDGLTLNPKNIYVHKTGHLIITTDIETLDIRTLGGKK
jgi:hypothetical protein